MVSGLGLFFVSKVCVFLCLVSVWFQKKVKPRVFDFKTFYRVFGYVFKGLGFNGEMTGDVSEGMVALAVSRVWVVFLASGGSRNVPLVIGQGYG